MHLNVGKSPGQTVRCWYSLKRGAPIYLLTVNHPQKKGGAAFYRPLRATAFHRISVQVISHQWVGQHHPISERTVPQSKAPLQGVNESLPPSTQMAVQPGGVSSFTIALDPVPF